MRVRRKSLRLPNGMGTIQFLGEKRRKPYQAVITTGYDLTGKQIRKSLGCEESYDKAYELLINYSNNHYDLQYFNFTLNDVFEKYQPIMKDDMINNKISRSHYKNLLSVYNNHLNNIYSLKLTDIKKRDLQEIINSSGLSSTGQGYIKNILSKLFNYGIDELEIPISKNPCIGLKIAEKQKSDMHKPFSLDEIKKIWEHSENYYCKLLLIYLYTGLRPSELLEIEIDNVFIDDNYMIGGNKTEAGKNRIIPIHPKIKPIIESLYNKDKDYLILNPNTNQRMSYDVWQKRFLTIMDSLNMNHTPHDTRHTFSTQLKVCGVSEIDRKWLMGHSFVNDVTNNVYTHLNHEYLLKEISKLNYE